MAEPEKIRCHWANTDELLKLYHDKQWGVAEHDDKNLFEMLNLEGAQAGLSWLTVLKKRDGYRHAFDNFNPEKIASYGQAKIDELLSNPEIIRNRLKVQAFIQNARVFLEITGRRGSFNIYVWGYVDNRPLDHKDRVRADEISLQMSKDFKKAGFKFVGQSICLSFMQANGLINDHEESCFRDLEISRQNSRK